MNLLPDMQKTDQRTAVSATGGAAGTGNVRWGRRTAITFSRQKKRKQRKTDAVGVRMERRIPASVFA